MDKAKLVDWLNDEYWRYSRRAEEQPSYSEEADRALGARDAINRVIQAVQSGRFEVA